MKAMLLAAGRGERLLPITDAVPKPLLPVLGRPLASSVLTRLAAEGIDEVVINLHHRPLSMQAALGDGTALGLRALRYSVEAEELLGTGGGLVQAAPLLRGDGPILVRNSDFISDVLLDEVVASHRRSGCPATLVVIPRREGYTPVTVDDGGRVLAFGDPATGRYLFTGYQIIDESILAMLPATGPSDIVRHAYRELAASGRLNAYVHRGFWWEFGTPPQYLEGSRALLEMPHEMRVALGDFDPVRRAGRAVLALGAGVVLPERDVDLEGFAVVGLGALVGEGARLRDTVVMPEAWIGPGSKLSRCIVGPGTEVPAGFVGDSEILAADAEPDAPPPPGCERRTGVLSRAFGAAARR